jgi:hypothetical protein
MSSSCQSTKVAKQALRSAGKVPTTTTATTTKNTTTVVSTTTANQSRQSSTVSSRTGVFSRRNVLTASSLKLQKELLLLRSGIAPYSTESILKLRGATVKENQVLYNAKDEKDNCGVGLIANLKSIPSRHVVEVADEMLVRMAHRGGVGCDPCSGDGAGKLGRSCCSVMVIWCCSRFDSFFPALTYSLTCCCVLLLILIMMNFIFLL